jgi:hypothetical protein
VASLYVQLRREGDALPRYNIFAELANRIQINKEQYFARNPEEAKLFEQAIKDEASLPEEPDEALSALNMKVMTESFILFMKRIGPITHVVETAYGLFTIRDTRDTLTFLILSTYVIIYQE